ncbi:hypothetical protein Lal_00033770, partial [Lupinus albus]
PCENHNKAFKEHGVGGSPSAQGGRNTARRDPYYSPTLQASRLAKFQGINQNYICYANMSWMVEQGFEFPHMGGLSSDGSPLGDCENALWNSFDVVEMYNLCICGLKYYVKGELTKVGLLTVESRLFHYVIAYIIIQ